MICPKGTPSLGSEGSDFPSSSGPETGPVARKVVVSSRRKPREKHGTHRKNVEKHGKSNGQPWEKKHALRLKTMSIQ